jgi:hypothetical protein
VVLQVAVALGLVAWFACTWEFFRALSNPRWGFETAALLVLDLPTPRTPPRHVLDAARAAPGLSSVTLADSLPSPDTREIGVAAEEAGAAAVPAGRLAIAEGFFETLGVGLLRGGSIRAEQVDRGEDVAVVSASLARTLWGEEDPIGRHLRLPESGRERTLTVIGVAPEIAYWPARPRPPHRVYVPLAVTAESRRTLKLIARRKAGHAVVDERLREALETAGVAANGEPAVPFDRALADLDRQLAAGRFFVGLVGTIGLLALALATAGVFAVTRQAVRAGSRDLGIRAALGAAPGRLVGLAFGQSAVKIGVGAAVGMGATYAGMHAAFPEALAVGMPAAGPWVQVAAASAAALLGGYLPARRAARTDPAAAIREE